MRPLLLLAAVAATASAQCYTFFGSGVTLRINITNINFQSGPAGLSGGTQTAYVFSGTNSFTLGGTTQTSASILTGAATIVYLPSIGSSQGVTTFTIAVPNADPDLTAKGEHTWSADLAGLGDLIPSRVFPGALPPISSWIGVQNTNYIQVASGSTRTKYPITAVGTCGGTSISGKGLGDISADPGSCGCGDPVNIANGNLFLQVADYRTAGANQLTFIRYYNSLASPDTLAGALGKNWRTNFDRYLRLSSGSVIAERPDGKELTFTLSGSNWVTDTDVDVKLSNSGTTWTLTGIDDTVETYTALGGTKARLQSIQARNGYTQTLQYDSNNQLITVTDSFQRQLNLAYTSGFLSSVTTPDGLVISYGIIPPRLTAARYSTSPATEQVYLYENASFPNALTAMSDGLNSRYASWTYDSSGRVLTAQHGAGVDLNTIAYNDTDGSRTVTNALGEQEVYKFTTLQGIAKVTEVDRLASGSTAAAKRTFTYDSNGYTAGSTDWNGNLTTYVNDIHGQPTSKAEAVGTPQARTTTTTYHPNFHLPTQIVTPGLTTSFTYDNNGELLTKTLTDTNGNNQSRTWTYTWSNFLPNSVKGPRTDVAELTRFGYDSSGAVTSITNALNQTTQITQHLPGGLPQTVVDPNGVTISLTYDERQRLLSSTIVTAAGSLTTQISYDAAGNLLTLTQPDGSAVTDTYDAGHRITGISDTLGESVSYTLDALGGITQVAAKDSSGVTQLKRTRSFDALGRILQQTGGAGQATSYTYDANGNQLTVTDPLSHATRRVFDALNRLTKVTDAANGAATTSFDANDRPTSGTDRNGATTSFTYDGFGDLIQQSSPAAGTIVYRYDAAGNIVQKFDGRGVIANYSYDALDRLISISYPGSGAENVTYNYDEAGHGFGAGRLTSVTDAVGTLSLSYDERGGVLDESRTSGAVTLATSYTRDAASRVASIKYPSGWLVTYARDAMGRITSAAAQPPGGGGPQSIVSSVAYQPFGPLRALTYGNGVAETRSFDLDYRLTKLVDAGTASVQNLTYGYDGADNVLSIADGAASANSQSLGYDALNRLTSASGPYGTLGYTYDANGNRLTESTATTDGLGSVTSLTYNQAGRLATVAAGGQQLAQYTYDGFGQRLIKTGSVTATTLYQYDRAGRLLEEADSQGRAQVDYVYLEGRPVAMIQPSNGKIFFLHNDRRGAPQIATDNSQAVAWSTSYQPFGQISTPPSVIVQDLRLPGQESDLETGLYHNGFREYVAAWGRYIQSDPVSLAGGFNTYAYVRGSPLRSIDPLGLCTVTTSGDRTVLTGAEGYQLTLATQDWMSKTAVQQAELMSIVDEPDDQPSYSYLAAIFQYVSGLIAKPNPPIDCSVTGVCGGIGIRG